MQDEARRKAKKKKLTHLHGALRLGGGDIGGLGCVRHDGRSDVSGEKDQEECKEGCREGGGFYMPARRCRRGRGYIIVVPVV